MLAMISKYASICIKPVLTIPEAVVNSEVTTEPIAASHLMHSKYVVRDGIASSATVWTGSTNFTDDAWTRQENNIIQIKVLVHPHCASSTSRNSGPAAILLQLAFTTTAP